MKKATEGGAGTRRPRRAYSTYPIQMRTPGSFLMVSFLTVAFLLVKTSKLHNSALIPPHELSLRPKKRHNIVAYSVLRRAPGDASGRQLWGLEVPKKVNKIELENPY